METEQHRQRPRKEDMRPVPQFSFLLRLRRHHLVFACDDRTGPGAYRCQQQEIYYQQQVQLVADTETGMHDESGQRSDTEHDMRQAPQVVITQGKFRYAFSQRHQQTDSKQAKDAETADLLQQRVTPQQVPAELVLYAACIGDM